MRTIATVGIAIVLGLLAIVLLNTYFGGHKAPVKAAPAPGVPVVVAAAPILRGTNILAPALKIVNFPAESVPAGAFSTIDEVAGAGATARVAFRDFATNDPVLKADVSERGGRLTMSTTLAAGMVAVSIRSNDVSGVAGFVLPGEHVDVLLTRLINAGPGQMPGQANEGQWVTQLLAEDVKVLGVDQVNDERTDKPAVARAVTVQVTPIQAQAIALAQSAGSVSLTLRQEGDHAVVSRRATWSSDLMVKPPGGTPSRRSTSDYSVHVTRGTTTTDYLMGGR